MAASDLRRYHVLLVALADEVLLNDPEKLANIRIAFHHVFEALEAINLYQLLLQHFELLDLLAGESEIVLGLFQMKLGLRFLIFRIFGVLSRGGLREVFYGV